MLTIVKPVYVLTIFKCRFTTIRSWITRVCICTLDHHTAIFPSDCAGFETKHFLDSLTVLQAIHLPENARCIDVGTGAGFPGAALLIARPDLRMTLLDGTRKKLGFIQETLDTVGLSAQIVHMRAEEAGQLSAHRAQYDLVTARAVANLRELCEYCLPFAGIDGTFVAMKSVRSDAEIAEAQSAIRLLGGKIDKNLSFSLPQTGERTLICIKKISQTPAKYPRPSAKIAKQPLK